MGKGLEQFENIKDDGIRYLKLRWTSMRLRTVDRASGLLGRAFGYMIFMALVFIASIFLLAALAFWLGDVLGHISYGFLISGGVFLIGGLIVYLCRDKILTNSLVRHLSDLLFNPEENGNGKIRE